MFINKLMIGSTIIGPTLTILFFQATQSSFEAGGVRTQKIGLQSTWSNRRPGSNKNAKKAKGKEKPSRFIALPRVSMVAEQGISFCTRRVPLQS